MKLDCITWTDGQHQVELVSPSIAYLQSNNPHLNRDWLKNFSVKKTERLKQLASQINGQFLITVTLADRTEAVITDRWSSIPVFFNQKLRGFTRQVKQLTVINDEALFSLMATRRLWGSMSLCTESKKIPAGAVAEVGSKDKVLISRYHERNFRSGGTSAAEMSAELAGSLRTAIKSARGASLFLSGGLDTRTILAAGDGMFAMAQTLGFDARSRELSVARKLCSIINVNHDELILNIKNWEKILPEAISQTKMGYPLNSLFLMLPPSDQLYLTGIGLDYMFQGMYLRESFEAPFSSLKELMLSLPCGNRYFLKERHHEYSDLFDNLVETVEKQVGRGRLNNISKNNALRTIMFDDPSMHYSYTDYLSQSAHRKVVIPAFCNELDDLWQICSPDLVMNKRLMLDTLSVLKPEFLAIKSANNDLPLNWKNKDRIALYFKNGLRRLMPGTVLEHQRRTWPTQGYMAAILIKFFGKQFFIDVSENLNQRWIDPAYIRSELDWFELRRRNRRFAVKHCDRENNLFYLLSIIAMVSTR